MVNLNSFYFLNNLRIFRLIELNKMRASEELAPEQARQFLFDLENAHNIFCRSVSE